MVTNRGSNLAASFKLASSQGLLWSEPLCWDYTMRYRLSCLHARQATISLRATCYMHQKIRGEQHQTAAYGDTLRPLLTQARAAGA